MGGLQFYTFSLPNDDRVVQRLFFIMMPQMMDRFRDRAQFNFGGGGGGILSTSGGARFGSNAPLLVRILLKCIPKSRAEVRNG
jgi:hypothetical protein